MEPRIGNRFRVGRKLGSGSFGEIFLGSCPITLKDLVLVLKFPSLPADDELFFPTVGLGLSVWMRRYQRADQRGGRNKTGEFLSIFSLISV